MAVRAERAMTRAREGAHGSQYRRTGRNCRRNRTRPLALTWPLLATPRTHLHFACAPVTALPAVSFVHRPTSLTAPYPVVSRFPHGSRGALHAVRRPRLPGRSILRGLRLQSLDVRGLRQTGEARLDHLQGLRR